MIFDTHCHYNIEPLASEWQRHWINAQTQGRVTDTIIVGVNAATSQLAIKQAMTETHLFASVGLHPTECASKEIIDTELEQLAELAQKQNVVAIGETGLDYFHQHTDELAALQRYSLEKQLRLAIKHRIPLILHVRDRKGQAYWDVLDILKAQSQLPKLILHCISGPQQYVAEAIELGAYIGLAGNITYASSQSLREIVKLAPPSRLLLETDAPFLPPVPDRGKSCQPWMIANTADFLRKELGVSEDALRRNAFDCFEKCSASGIE